ncbi:MAG: T9SS type A sorting domain-containing protein [Flavobacteriales bacterium]
MKHSVLLSAALLTLSAQAQTTVTVTTGAGNGTQTYYSLANGEQASANLADWDLAFEINSFNSSILVNTAKGLKVYETNAAVDEWELLTTPDVANWTALQNSETHWSQGALTHGNNLSQPDGLNVGWGNYNMITHTIVGTKIYAIEDLEGNFRKLRINSLATGTYSFTYAALDGSGEQTSTLLKSNFVGKNFGYFNLDTNSSVDLEPAADDWDLLFTKYIAVIPAPEPTPYPVAGVLQNKRVMAMQVDGVPTDEATWNGADLDSAINIIGSDWKTFNMTTFQYEYAVDRTYFVEDRDFNIWKLIFIGYGGSATGDMTFTQELVSSVGVEEEAFGQLAVFPNPTNQGQVNIVLSSEVRNGQLAVVDRAGRTVKEQLVSGGGALAAVPVDLAGLEAGLYLIRLDYPGSVLTTRVVVE